MITMLENNENEKENTYESLSLISDNKFSAL